MKVSTVSAIAAFVVATVAMTIAGMPFWSARAWLVAAAFVAVWILGETYGRTRR